VFAVSTLLRLASLPLLFRLRAQVAARQTV
jgi:hypothetical protein